MAHEDEEFLRGLKALLDKHPNMAGGFSVESVSQSEEAPKPEASDEKRCIRYGRDPNTGELVCLEYA